VAAIALAVIMAGGAPVLATASIGSGAHPRGPLVLTAATCGTSLTPRCVGPDAPPVPGAGHDLYVTATNLTVLLGDPVTFQGYLPNGSAAEPGTYSWTFGDHQWENLTDFSVTHVYQNPGIYPVYCQATNYSGMRTDNAGSLLTILVVDSYWNDTALAHARVAGGVVGSGGLADDRAPLLAAGQSVEFEGILLAPPVDATYQVGSVSFAMLDLPGSYLSWHPSGARWFANVSLPSPAPAPGFYRLQFQSMAVPIAGQSGPSLDRNFTFVIVVGAGYGLLPARLPTPLDRGTLRVEGLTGGGSTLDPALAYDSVDEETIANVYEQLITYNGSLSGDTNNDFVPALATCVPGSPLCQSLYGSDLVSGWNYTFVIDAKARFYDPTTQANWSVYPSDVVFSVARTLAFSTLPCSGCNNGWILAQTLLPGLSSSQNASNPSWDGGVHAPFNNTPSNIFASMVVNGSACPTVSGHFVGDGCVTFQAHGDDRSWPFFLDVLANPLGASIVPAGWFSAAAQNAGLPGWTYGNVGGDGDQPLPPITGAALLLLNATAWDVFESTGSSPPYWGNVQFAMAGSGPYYLSSYTPGLRYQLQANPDYSGNSQCTTPGCPPASASYIPTVNESFQPGTDAAALAAIANGSIDLGLTDPMNVTSQLSLFEGGGAWLEEQPSSVTDFAPFQMWFSPTATQALVGNIGTNVVNIPYDFFAHLGMRHLFTASFPYATAESSVRNAHGFGFAGNYGGAIAPYLPDYPANVSWPAGDPVQSSSVVGSAGWWWAQITNVSSPYYDNETALCTAGSPCAFPMFPTQSFDYAEMSLWTREVNATTGGAIQPYVFNTSFINVVLSALYSSPGTGDTPLYGLAWLADYPDASDYLTPLYLADSTYTYASAVNEAFSALAGTGCASTLYAYAYGGAALNDSCQGPAYALMSTAASQAANLPLGANRTFAYNEIEQVANRLALYTYTRVPQALEVVAPWIDPSSVVVQPSTFGSSYRVFSDYRYLNSSATPNPLAAYGPVVSPDPTNISVGGNLSLAAAAGGGYGGYSYTWNGLPPECAGFDLANFTCVLRTPGVYSLNVTVNDASGASATSHSVRLFVYGAPRPLSASDHASVTAGPAPLAVTFSSVVAGGVGPYTLNWSFGDGNFSALANPGRTFTATGTYTVRLNVTDSEGRHATAAPNLMIVVRTPLTGAAVGSSVGTLDLGGTTHLSVTFTGGTPPITVYWSTLPPGCTSANATSLPCTPSVAGVYVVGANLTDSAGSTVAATPVQFIVALPLTVAVPTPSASTTEVGQTVSFTTVGSGGSAPYASYLWSGLPTGACTGLTGAVATCTFTAAATLSVTVQVVDAIGVTSPASLALAYIVHPMLALGVVAISNGTVSGSTTTVPDFTTITLTTTIEGGLAPVAIRWSGLPPECPAGVTASFACQLSTPGAYSVKVTATDADGVVASQSSTLIVTSGSTSPTGGGSGNGLLLPIVIGVVIAAVALAAAALLLRRRGRAPPDEAPASAAPEEPADWTPGAGEPAGGSASPPPDPGPADG
jgi:PKD repeat protein